MNYWKPAITIFITALYLGSCSEDFQLTEPYKAIPVIYAIIDRSDSAQYFRIEKAFIDENIPASKIAQRADSLYYPNAEVKLYDLTTNKVFTLVKVDGNLEGYPRNSGPFATAPNYLYKLLTKQKILIGGDSLKIELNRNDGNALVTSRISLVDTIRFEYPDANTRQLKIFYGSAFPFQWKNKSNTSVFDLFSKVYIEERNIANDTLIQIDTIEIPLGKNIFGTVGRTDNFTSTKVYGSSFYNFFHDKLTPKSGIYRNIDKIEFYLTGGGPEIGQYYNILNANTGITASQEIPRYSNISEGFGIFSSVITIVKTITPQEPTIDSLQTNPLTRDLNFKK